MRITKEQLLALAEQFCALKPESRFAALDYKFQRSSVPRAIITTRRNGSDTVLTLAAVEGRKVRLTKTLPISDKAREKAGIKTTIFGAITKPTIDDIQAAYVKLVEKYSAAAKLHNAVVQLQHAESAAQERYDAEVKKALCTYGTFQPKFFREHGSGQISSINFDRTIDLKLDNLTLEQATAILNFLGAPKECPVPAENYVREQFVLDETEWAALTPERRAKLTQEQRELLYGRKNF